MRSARQVLVAIAASGFCAAAHGESLAGRVTDTMKAAVFEAATVRLPGIGVEAKTDRNGFFRISDVPPGVHAVVIEFPDGRSVGTRVLVRSDRPLTFSEFDYSRIVPPDEDDDY
ncbi:MAG: carboxypeptidase regulatory-like domain-containing protein [Betaproteobacteria bacterium]|nr:carboxypeptidase regulatory-like domain-containing protein [Betaproteobacteria bacterium]